MRQDGNTGVDNGPVKPAQNGKFVRGTATWYCCTRGYGRGEMVAAAGAEIRKGKWRGRVVHVCRGAKCITVRLVDWCGCPGNRIIDLHPAAFDRLGSLSEGVIRVVVGW